MNWRSSLAILLLTLLVFPHSLVRSQTKGAESSNLDGFAPQEAIAENRWEERFRAVPQSSSAREHLRRLTIEPHVAGTREDYQTALYVRDQMRSFGLTSDLKEYQVLLQYPKQPSIVEMIKPRRVRLQTVEAVIPEDPSSSNHKIIPLFNSYSASADVTAPLLYVNYGLPSDYEALKKIGVDAKGKIVIARYGQSFRGVKAKVAEQNGAIGLIIYSDPAEDGYTQGDVYPKGPWRPSESAQRGSVLYIFEYPGDPLTPGVPSIPGQPRIRIEEATNLPRIPVQPLSYGEARKLIEALRGPLRPKGFQGGLPFPYHTGGTNDVRVRLKTDLEYAERTIWDVITRIDGREEPDRWVIMGNHRDAWAFGAVDPNSGTTAMLEAGRGFGQLLKAGWKPRRTMFLCSWDGEEFGMIGSTEWVEENADDLREKAVAYLNVDSAVSGPNFGASSVPSLWKLIRSTTRDIYDPKSGKTLYQAWQDHARESLSEAELVDLAAGPERAPAEARIGGLGSGSDYTSFLDHLGIPALNMGFGGEGGVYHSAYDSFYWMTKFGDPTFAYHVAAAQIWGTIAMRLADASALPLDYTDYAAQLRDFLTETQRTAARRRLADAFDAKALNDAIKDFMEAAAHIDKRKREAVREIETKGTTNSTNQRTLARLRRINDALVAAERALTDTRGLRGRSWYKHQIYAPGSYTGYAVQPMPDLLQAIEDRNPTNAREAATRITEAITRATEVLRKAGE